MCMFDTVCYGSTRCGESHVVGHSQLQVHLFLILTTSGSALILFVSQ